MKSLYFSRLIVMSICHPSYFRIYEKELDSWYVHKGRKFIEKSNISLEKNRLERFYGLTLRDILPQLFKVGRGRTGFYLVNLKEQQFYFCGNSPNDIKQKFLELGIIRS